MISAPCGTRELDDVVYGIFCQCFRVIDQLLHAHHVEVLVDETGPLAVKLVRHAAGTNQHNLQVFVVRIDCPPDGFAKGAAGLISIKCSPCRR